MNESTDSTTTSGVRGRAASLKKRLKEDGQEKIESGKRAAADQIAEIADAIDVAGAQLDQSQPTLANYASKLADGVGSLATRLREDSLEDLYSEMRRVATRHPGMFLLGSAALGVVLARFMKASGEQSFASGEQAYGGEELGEIAESEGQPKDQPDDQLWGESAETDEPAANPAIYGQGGTGESPGSPQRGV